VLRIARRLMAPANHLHEYRDELGRTQRIFLNGIPRYRKQLPSETNVLPTSALSPPPFGLTPAPSSHGYDPYTTTHGFSTLSYDATNRRSSYHVDCVCRYSASTNNTTSPLAHTTFPRFRSQTLSHTGRTYRMPDANPSDEAEDIPTQPFPHFTRCID
jgi:hypothetical protein